MNDFNGQKKGIRRQPARPKDLQGQLATPHCSMRVPADQTSEKENYHFLLCHPIWCYPFHRFPEENITLHLGISCPTALGKGSVACLPVGELLCFGVFTVCIILYVVLSHMGHLICRLSIASFSPFPDEPTPFLMVWNIIMTPSNKYLARNPFIKNHD